MNAIADLIRQCAEHGIRLSSKEDRLLVDAPKGALTDPLRQAIADNKPALLRHLAGSGQPLALKRMPNPESIPLSLAQQRIWSLANIERHSSTYNVPVVYELEGKLNLVALEKALTQVSNRHDALRTTIGVNEDGLSFQRISPAGDVRLEIQDLRKSIVVLDKKEAVKLISGAVNEEISRPLDIEAGPLWRGKLLRIGAERRVLVMTFHHIIFDGLSRNILTRELSEHYNSLTLSQSPADLPALEIQFSDYAIWQRSLVESAGYQRQIEYWRKELQDVSYPTKIPSHAPRSDGNSSLQSAYFSFTPALSEALSTLASRSKSSPFVILAAAFALLLNRYTEQSKLIICAPMASRNRRELESLIGYFNNILPVVIGISDSGSFDSLLATARKKVLEAYDNQLVAIQEIAEFPNLARVPLTRVMVSYQDVSEDALQLNGITSNSVKMRKGTADFDLALYCEKKGSGMGGVLDFNADLFVPELIKRMMQNFQRILWGCLKNPDIDISKIPRLGKKRQNVVEVLKAHDQIDDAYVLADTESGNLVAYLVLNEHDVPRLEDIRAYMREKLPDYKVPARLVPVDQFPYTDEGSVDESVLPRPSGGRDYLGIEYVAPQSDLERDLARLWRQVLWLDHDVGTRDTFSGLGGHSLLSVQLVTEVEKQLGHTIPLAALARISTIQDMAYAIENPQDFMADAGPPGRASELPASVFKAILAHTASWEGYRRSQHSVIVGLNTEGSEAPLFWCLQRYQELQQIARYLGPEIPVYGMRSGNRVMVKSPENYRLLASHYVTEITELQPEGAIRIGGNCQAAEIAFYAAKQLQAMGREIAILILHERFVPEVYSGKVAMTYGRDSLFNPGFLYSEPSKGWWKYYTGPIYFKEVDGGHGLYFREPYVKDLVGTIDRFLEESEHPDSISDLMLNAPDTAVSESQRLSMADYRAGIECPVIRQLKKGQTIEVPIEITNAGVNGWKPYASSGIAVRSLWCPADRSDFPKMDKTMPLETGLPPGKTLSLSFPLSAPIKSGEWILEFDLVDEGVTSFREQGNDAYAQKVQVS